MSELLAQKGHIHFEIVGFELAVESPCFEDKIFLCRNEVGVFEQVSQKLEFLACEVDASVLR